MYERYYGLYELPFELTPDPRFLFLTARHREALSNLQYGLRSAKAITVLIGEAGTGKTTLLRAALESPDCQGVRCVSINNTALSRGEFVETLARSFELGARAGESKAVLIAELERTLCEARRRGQVTALVIDEAQSLSPELLEEIRLLANIETATQKLLPVVLAGQPELADRLSDPALRQLKQRVALRCDVEPFGLNETAACIAFRIKVAGGDASRLFTREAVTLIHECSQGIPRTVCVLCDNALVTAMALDRRPVDSTIVLEVSRDFDFHRGDAGSSSPVGHVPEGELASIAQPRQAEVENPVARQAAVQPRGFRWFTTVGSKPDRSGAA